MAISRSSTAVVPQALQRLGYGEGEIGEIVRYAVGHGTLRNAPGVNHETLRARGFTETSIDAVENAITDAFDIRFAFNKWTLGEAFCSEKLGIAEQSLNDVSFCLLSALWASESEEIDEANTYVCGAMTLEGAPFLKAEHLAGVRLRQRLRPQRDPVALGGEPHPDDGIGPAVY